MIDKTRGIFLHGVKYSETSLIASFYTEMFGRQTFIINGIRSKTSQVKAAIFQPLYLLDLEVYFKPGREMNRLKNARLSFAYSSIPFDIRKSTQILFLSEILYKCLKEEETNPELFDFLHDSLTLLDQTESGVSNFHVWFLFKLTRFLGIDPNAENIAISNFFDLESASFVFHEPVHSQYADKHLTSLFARLFDDSRSNFESLEYTQNDRKLVLEKLLQYYHIHFGHLGEIRSLNVLKEVLK